MEWDAKPPHSLTYYKHGPRTRITRSTDKPASPWLHAVCLFN